MSDSLTRSCLLRNLSPPPTSLFQYPSVTVVSSKISHTSPSGFVPPSLFSTNTVDPVQGRGKDRTSPPEDGKEGESTSLTLVSLPSLSPVVPSLRVPREDETGGRSTLPCTSSSTGTCSVGGWPKTPYSSVRRGTSSHSRHSSRTSYTSDWTDRSLPETPTPPSGQV